MPKNKDKKEKLDQEKKEDTNQDIVTIIKLTIRVFALAA